MVELSEAFDNAKRKEKEELEAHIPMLDYLNIKPDAPKEEPPPERSPGTKGRLRCNGPYECALF